MKKLLHSLVQIPCWRSLGYLLIIVLCLTKSSLANIAPVNKKIVIIENKGQVQSNEDINCYLIMDDYSAFFKPSGVSYCQDQAGDRQRIDVHFLGSHPNPEIERTYLPASSFIYNQEGKRDEVSHLSDIYYRDLYPHIDLHYYVTDSGTLKYDFIVYPEGDPAQIQVQYIGAGKLRNPENGSLLIPTAMGTYLEDQPISFQNNRIIKSEYNIINNILGFDLEDYNNADTLIIDPSIRWSTFHGGARSDEGVSMDYDKNLNLYVLGNTNSLDFPSQPGFFSNQLKGSSDVFLSKYNSSGKLVWSSYIGGAGTEEAVDILCDRKGSIYLTFNTTSADLPVKGPFLSSKSKGEDVYLMKIDSQARIIWSGYYGGGLHDFASDLVLTDLSKLYLVGGTSSPGLVQDSHAYQHVLAGDTDGFILHLDTSAKPIWTTYLGTSGSDYLTAAQPIDSNKIIVTGASSRDTIEDHDWIKRGKQVIKTNGFVAYLVDMDSLAWIKHFGGNGHDLPMAMNISHRYRSAATITIGGRTDSDDIIIGQQDSIQSKYGGGNSDGFLLQLNKYGFYLSFNYLGGRGDDEISSLDSDDDVLLVAGSSSSKTFEWTHYNSPKHVLQGKNAGNTDIFYINFDHNLIHHTSSYLGGGANDYLAKAIFYNGGQAFLGRTTSANYPSTTNASQPVKSSGFDAFLSIICTSPYNIIGGHGCTKDGPVDKLLGTSIRMDFKPEYLWQKKTRYDWENMTDQTSALLLNDFIEQATYYRRLSYTSMCTDTSVWRLVRRGEYPYADFKTKGGNCEGDSIHLHSTSSISEGGLRYTWSVNYQVINQDSSWSYIFPKVDEIYYIKLDVISDSNCVSGHDQSVYYWRPQISFTSHSSCNSDAVHLIPSKVYPSEFVSVDWHIAEKYNRKTNNAFQISLDTFGKYQVRMAASNQDCSDTFRSEIYYAPKMALDFEFGNQCTNDSIFIFNKSTHSYPFKNYQWILGSGETLSGENPVVFFPKEGLQSILLKATDTFNCTDTLYKEIPIYDPPEAQWTVKQPCANDSFYVEFIYPQPDHFYAAKWDMGDGKPAVEKHRFAYKFDTFGRYEVNAILKIDSLSCVDSQRIDIRYDTTLTAEFNSRDNCHLDNIWVRNKTKGNLDSVSWHWHFSGDKTSQLFHPEMVLPAGSYTIKLKALRNDGCQDSIEKPFIVHPLPTPSFTFDTVCVGSDVTFTQTSDTSGMAIKAVKWEFGDGARSTEYHPKYSFPFTRTFQTKLILTSQEGCMDTTERDVDIRQNPTARTNQVNIACYGQDSGWVLIVPSEGWGRYRIAWEKHPSIKKFELSGLSQGDYPFVLTDKMGCSSRQIVTIESPDSVEVVQPMDLSLCFGEEEIVTFDGVGGTTPYNFRLLADDPSCIINRLDKNKFSVITNQETNFTLRIRDANDCLSQEKTFHAQSQPLPDLSLSDSIVFVLRDMAFELEALSSKISEFVWTPHRLFDNSTSQRPRIKVSQNEHITVTSKDTNYCITSASARVIVIELEIPTAFTPNDDGVNDQWVIRGWDIFPNAEIEIYNRWGLKLFTSDADHPYWDGTYQGENVSATTYYYILKPNSNGEELTGTVHILK